MLLMPPELPQQASGVRRHRPEGDVSNTMHSIIQGIARDADEAANVGSQRSKLRRSESCIVISTRVYVSIIS